MDTYDDFDVAALKRALEDPALDPMERDLLYDLVSDVLESARRGMSVSGLYAGFTSSGDEGVAGEAARKKVDSRKLDPHLQPRHPTFLRECWAL